MGLNFDGILLPDLHFAVMAEQFGKKSVSIEFIKDPGEDQREREGEKEFLSFTEGPLTGLVIVWGHLFPLDCPLCGLPVGRGRELWLLHP